MASTVVGPPQWPVSMRVLASYDVQRSKAPAAGSSKDWPWWPGLFCFLPVSRACFSNILRNLWASQYPLELLLWVSFCHLWIWTITIIVCNNANVKVHIFMVPNSLKLLSNHYFICTWKLKRLMGFSVCFVCLFVFNLVISFCLIYEVGGVDFEGKFCVKFFYNTLKSQSQKWI